MSIVCPVKTALTDSELDQIFGDGIKNGLLPSSPNGTSDRESNGMLTAKAVSYIIANLKSVGVIPKPTPTNADTFMKKQAELLKNIQEEYCFYDSRYKYSLSRLFEAIQQGYITNTGDTQAAIQKYLATTQILNKRLNDLIQIINATTANMLEESSELEAQINAFNDKIKEQKQKLDNQNKIISSSQAVTQINKEMVKFTEEKARYSDNLLKLYSVLNIVALGLLVYVYKSTP